MAKKLTKAKAREILHDKEVHGHPLTDKQRRFFGAVASGRGWLDKYENGGFAQGGEQVRPQILQQFEDYRNSPEGKDYFRMQEENRIAKKRSGRIEYSDIDPITDIALPLAGIAGTVGKQAIKQGVKNIGEAISTHSPIFMQTENSMTRGIGSGSLGYRDLLESGVVRANPRGRLSVPNQMAKNMKMLEANGFSTKEIEEVASNNLSESTFKKLKTLESAEPAKVPGTISLRRKTLLDNFEDYNQYKNQPLNPDYEQAFWYESGGMPNYSNYPGDYFVRLSNKQAYNPHVPPGHYHPTTESPVALSDPNLQIFRKINIPIINKPIGVRVPKYKDGGMQEYQENYNDASVSYPPNFVGMANANKGFDYNSAWGGRWRNGGQAKVWNPELAKTDTEFLKWYDENTAEAKEGRPFNSPGSVYDFYSYFRNTPKQELSNPEAHFPDTYKYPNHPTFSNESLYSTPEKPGGTWKSEMFNPRGKFNFQMGGAIPGANGFQYARHGAPSEGKYAKKTLPSAQSGKMMSYYQQGLDFEPKTISEDGGKFIGGPGAKRMIANAIEEYNLPENIEARRMQAAKERAAKISGRIDYSEIDPITDVALPILSAPGVAKGLFSGAENITEELLKSKVVNSKTFDKVGNMLRNVKKTITPTYHKEASTQLQKANRYLRDWYTDPATLEKLRKTTYDYEEFMANRFGVSPNDARIQEQIANTIAEREALFIKRINEGNTDIQYNPVLKNIWNKYVKGEKAKVSKGAIGTSWTDKETLRSSNYVRKALNPRQRGNTMVHEGSHGADAGGELFNQDEIELLQGGFDTRHDSDYAKYLLDPTEIRARKQQIFYNENLRPDAKFSKEQIDNIIQKGLEGKYKIDPEWFQMIDSPKNFGKMMNEMWGTVPIAVGATTVEKQKDGGTIAKEGASLQLDKLDQLTNFTNYNKPTRGGWLDKYQ